MSGFIAIYNIDGEPVDGHLIHSLTNTLKFRGPDKQKVWIDGNIGMGHALFKTTFEAEYENQPVSIDNKVWITCSARIDDRENLVNKMGLKHSLDLSKTPDSELILHAYRKWGEKCLTHLLGDFAFVIWDNREKKLFCAKDRFGMRQLYYAQIKNTFIISNNMRTIMHYPRIQRQFSDKAIAGFLLFGDHHWLDLSLTAFENVSALRPAHYLIVKNSSYILKKYWDIPTDIPLLSYKKEQDYIEHFQEVFQTAVDDRIRTTNVTISLSGGIDSTTIAATINRIREKKYFNVHAVTAGYETIIKDDEKYYATLAAEHLKIPIDFISGDKFPMIKSNLITTYPKQMISPDFWFEIQKRFLKYSRVTLGGYAADNLLDYSSMISTFKEIGPLSLFAELIKSYKRYGDIPSFGFDFKKQIKQLIYFTLNKKNTLQYPSWIEPDFAKSINIDELLKEDSKNTKLRHFNAYYSLLYPNWNSDESLYNSPLTLPEVRDPFLDTRVVELLFSFPSLPWFYKKHILRSSMKNHLPKSILKRPKTFAGYLSHAHVSQPKNDWIDTYPFVQEILKYVKVENISPLKRGVSGPSISDRDLKPFYLNEWIKNITKLHKEI